MSHRTLYWMPGTCALGVHIALEMIGQPYEATLVPRENLKSPDYLAINPMGVVPSLDEDGLIHVEAGAILFHLTDAEPGAGLGPAPGAALRADFYRWVAWLTGTVHPHFWPFFFPARYAAPEAMHEAVREAAALRVYGDWDLLEAHLAGRDWLVSATMTAADAMLVPMARWGMRLPRPTREWPALFGHLQKLEALPVVAAAIKAQGLAPTA